MPADAWAAVRALRRRHRRRRRPVHGRAHGRPLRPLRRRLSRDVRLGRGPLPGVPGERLVVQLLCSPRDEGRQPIRLAVPRRARRRRRSRRDAPVDVARRVRSLAGCTYPPPLPAAVLLGMRRPGRRRAPGAAPRASNPSQESYEDSFDVAARHSLGGGAATEEAMSMARATAGSSRRTDTLSLCRPTPPFRTTSPEAAPAASLAPTSARRASSRASPFGPSSAFGSLKSLSGRRSHNSASTPPVPGGGDAELSPMPRSHSRLSLRARLSRTLSRRSSSRRTRSRRRC